MSRKFAESRLLSLRSMRLLVGGICLALAYACGGDGPTTVPPPVRTCNGPTLNTDSGTVALFLTTANGSFLPLRVGPAVAVLDSGRLVLRPDSSYSSVSFFRRVQVDATPRVTDSTVDAGHYSVCGSKVQFTSATGPVHAATVSGLTLTAGLPSENVVPGAGADTLRLWFTPSVREALCADGTADSLALASGSYRLLTVDGTTPPAQLPDTYPYTIQIASATATIGGGGYAIEGRGSTTKPGTNDVELFSDTGTIVSCATVWHFRSATNDTMYTVHSTSASLMVEFPADFIGYDYGFLGDDGPVTLELEKIP